MIGFDDIRVPVMTEGTNKTEQKKEVVNLLLKHLEGIVGRSIPRLDEYISQPDLNRYGDALHSYNAIRKSQHHGECMSDAREAELRHRCVFDVQDSCFRLSEIAMASACGFPLS